jgi:Sec-independent protein secretion pathway component TatC
MSKSKEMPFLGHLEELRWRILWCALAVGLGAVIGIYATMRFDVIGVLTAPLFSVVNGLGSSDAVFLGLLETERLVFLDLTEPLVGVLALATYSMRTAGRRSLPST